MSGQSHLGKAAVDAGVLQPPSLSVQEPHAQFLSQLPVQDALIDSGPLLALFNRSDKYGTPPHGFGCKRTPKCACTAHGLC
jgi:hypothetical protein